MITSFGPAFTCSLIFFLCQVVRFCHKRARFTRFCMSITDKRSKLIRDSFLDGSVKPATGNPISINDLFFSIRGLKSLVYSNSGIPVFLKIVFQRFDVKVWGAILTRINDNMHEFYYYEW